MLAWFIEDHPVTVFLVVVAVACFCYAVWSWFK